MEVIVFLIIFLVLLSAINAQFPNNGCFNPQYAFGTSFQVSYRQSPNYFPSVSNQQPYQSVVLPPNQGSPFQPYPPNGQQSTQQYGQTVYPQYGEPYIQGGQSPTYQPQYGQPYNQGVPNYSPTNQPQVQYSTTSDYQPNLTYGTTTPIPLVQTSTYTPPYGYDSSTTGPYTFAPPSYLQNNQGQPFPYNQPQYGGQPLQGPYPTNQPQYSGQQGIQTSYPPQYQQQYGGPTQAPYPPSNQQQYGGPQSTQGFNNPAQQFQQTTYPPQYQQQYGGQQQTQLPYTPQQYGGPTQTPYPPQNQPQYGGQQTTQSPYLQQIQPNGNNPKDDRYSFVPYNQNPYLYEGQQLSTEFPYFLDPYKKK